MNDLSPSHPLSQSSLVRRLSGISENFRSNRNHIRKFGRIVTISENFRSNRYFRIFSDISENFRIFSEFSDIFGYIRIFGYFRIFSDIFGYFRIYPKIKKNSCQHWILDFAKFRILQKISKNRPIRIRTTIDVFINE